jgi:tetratricopeptide (TPR) repeat protein
VSGASVYRAALGLFRARQFPSVVAVCTDALADFSDNLHLRLLRARALLALRRDEEGQRELRECLRLDPRSARAYRTLGELSLRRDELESAEIFLREALRLDPGDPDAADLLDIAKSLNQPTVAVEKLPAATVTVGCTFPARPQAPHREPAAAGTDLPKPRRANARPPRLAVGSSGVAGPDHARRKSR